MTTTTVNATKQLQHLQWNDIPQDVVHEAKRSLINILGLSINAANHPSVRPLLSLGSSPVPEATASSRIVGRRLSAPLHLAALINGYTAHLADFDDTHLATIVHPSAPVYPVALGFAEWLDSTGQELLLAFILGCEFEIRIAQALGASHFSRGWHVTSTVGSLGGSVAAARMLNLDENSFLNALGIAASMTGGLMNALGSHAKPFHPGKAAYNGVMSGLLARNQFTGPNDLDGRRSFLRLASDNPQLHVLEKGLGDTWYFRSNTYKPYPCGIVSHAAIECAVRIHSANKNAEDIDEVFLTVHPDVPKVMGTRHPDSGLKAKFSVYHTVALALQHGRVLPAHFSDELVADKVIRDLRDKIRLTVNSDFTRDEAEIEVRRSNQPVERVHVDHAIGSVERPMTDGEIEEKFLSLCTTSVNPELAPTLTLSEARELLDRLWTLDAVKSVRSLL